MIGSILLYRQLLDSYVFANPIMLKIWIWCLLKANFKRTHFPIQIGSGTSIITLERGQFLYGRRKANEELNIPGTTIDYHLKRLVMKGMIKIKPSKHYSIITLIKYDDYQKAKKVALATNHQPNSNQSSTIEQAISNELAQNNKDNTDKKPNNKVDLTFISDENYFKLVKKWINYKRERKDRLTQSGIEVFYKKLSKISDNNHNLANEIIETSMANGWAGIFEPKVKSYPAPKRSPNILSDTSFSK